MELVRACVEGPDPAAWSEFIRRFHRVIAATVVKVCRQWGSITPELVDDLIQDTYVKICADGFRILREFDPQHSDAIFGLLKSVAYSVVQDHFRAETTAKRGGGRRRAPLTEMLTAAQGAVEDIERGVLIEQIRGHLQSFSERDRLIFWLHFRQGMSARGIAEIPALELTPKGVESTLFRVTRQLRQELVHSE